MTDKPISEMEPGDPVKPVEAPKKEASNSVTAWNAAIEAAALCVESRVGLNASFHAAAVRALKK